MLDWSTPEFWIGAVGGSFVGSAVTLYTYHHKHRYEKRNRDRDKKQQAYKQYAVFVGLYFDELMLFAEAWPILSQIERGVASDEDVEEFRRVRAKGDSNLEKLHEPIEAALADIGMLAPKHLHDAAADVFEVTLKLIENLNRNEDIDSEPFQAEFRKLLHEFRAAARADLGIQQ